MNVHKLTEGAILLAVFIVILLMTLYIPVIGIVLNFFLALPFIIFSAKSDRKQIILFLAGALLLSFIVGGLAGMAFAFLYGLAGSVIGDFIREKKSRMSGFMAGSVAYLVGLVTLYIVSVVFFEINFFKDMLREFEQTFARSIDMVDLPSQYTKEELMQQFQSLLGVLETLIPSFFVLVSFIYVFIIELVSFPIASRFVKEIPKWKPFRELTLPRSLLWYYLIVLLISLFVRLEPGNYWYAVILNLSFILQFFMFIQGLSFIYYFFHAKKQSKAVPVLITVAVFVFPVFLLPLVRILGIIDLGFNLREKIKI